MPLADRHRDCHPFLGVVLAGVFTEGSLNQLRSHGFTVLYFSYESIIEASASAGIDAAYHEDTPDSVLLRRVRQYEKLSPKKKEGIAASLRHRHGTDLESFIVALRRTLMRKIESIYVLPLHGSARTLGTVDEAITFIQSFDESKHEMPFVRYEVGVRYSNGDEVRGHFNDKAHAIAFLQQMQ